MAPKWLAKTKYGAKPKPKATAPPPSPSPSPSHAPEARASAPVPARAPAERGAAHCAPQKAPATQPGAPEAPQSAPVPALAPADKGAPHSAPPKAMAPQPRAPEALHSAPVPALAPADRGARPSAPPQAPPQPPPGGVDFVMIPPQPSAQPPSLRAPEPQQCARVPAMAPVDSGAPQGAQPSAPSLRAPEPQQSAPVPAMAPVDSGAPQGAQPSAPAMRAPEPQQSAPVPAMAPGDSGAPQGTQPSAPAMRAPELQQSAPVPAMAPVDSGAPQGAQPSSQPPCAAQPQQPTLLPTTATLNNMDYGLDDNLVEGFTQRWLDRDKFVTKASEVYTVHEKAAAEVWADKNGTKRRLAFEEWRPHGDGDGDGNAPPPPQWASQMEVWGNYELSDGDMVRGWICSNHHWDKNKPDFEARVHGDGISGQRVWISCANKPRTNLADTYWCKIVPDTCAFQTLRREIQDGEAWPQLLANMRAEPRDTPPLSTEDQDILKHLVKQHGLNPSQALAVRQVLDESCITALTGGAGTGKSETLVACSKAS